MIDWKEKKYILKKSPFKFYKIELTGKENSWICEAFIFVKRENKIYQLPSLLLKRVENSDIHFRLFNLKNKDLIKLFEKSPIRQDKIINDLVINDEDLSLNLFESESEEEEDQDKIISLFVNTIEIQIENKDEWNILLKNLKKFNIDSYFIEHNNLKDKIFISFIYEDKNEQDYNYEKLKNKFSQKEFILDNKARKIIISDKEISLLEKINYNWSNNGIIEQIYKLFYSFEEESIKSKDEFLKKKEIIKKTIFQQIDSYLTKTTDDKIWVLSKQWDTKIINLSQEEKIEKLNKNLNFSKMLWIISIIWTVIVPFALIWNIFLWYLSYKSYRKRKMELSNLQK